MAQGEAECLICLKTPPKCYTHTSIVGALSDLLHLLVFLLGAFISHAQTASIFSDQTINKCLCNLFIVIEPTGRNILASYSFMWAIGNRGNGNRKQKVELKNRNGEIVI